MVSHHWCLWEEWCPIVGVFGRNGVPSLVSLGGMVSHHWRQFGGTAPCCRCQ
ncbi:unnamed protein product [Staurois parvus]|uniref:Uncharacterized protein n=1 Tax=Staurois parvus TaxID=386267 RepID=A0ABN9HBS5_9NEOB|nr:unnamed protein product [Staurois parvus]